MVAKRSIAVQVADGALVAQSNLRCGHLQPAVRHNTGSDGSVLSLRGDIAVQQPGGRRAARRARQREREQERLAAERCEREEALLMSEFTARHEDSRDCRYRGLRDAAERIAGELRAEILTTLPNRSPTIARSVPGCSWTCWPTLKSVAMALERMVGVMYRSPRPATALWWRAGRTTSARSSLSVRAAPSCA
jgi:hypothetical protein